MSNNTTIVERVVSLEFDNKHFEKNVETSMGTIAKLKKALKFEESAKGLEEVNKVSKKVDMSTLSDSVESVKNRFSALEVIGVTALANITNSAVNTGKRLAASLSIDQITAGFTKYEQKTSSVQTIMNATGKSIDEVSGYLDKLMWYSDETSYGFTDMTASLAQLTSAGGDIDKLIPMIEGIANATAFAGKGAAEFSRVIYNLNQSYSAGHLQLMDWKSLDLAGVTSKQLKQTLIDTAEELGKITEGQVTIANFNETLQDKWADTEVMEKAFGKFSELTEAAYKAVEAGQYDTAAEAIAALSGEYDEVAVKAFKSAQEAKSFTEAIEATKDAVSSGWMRTAEIVFGDYEEAKDLWTGLANTLWDVFASGGERRNELLSKSLRSGWDSFMAEGIFDESEYSYRITEVAQKYGVALDKMKDENGEIMSTTEALRKCLADGTLSSEVLSESLNSLAYSYANVSEEELLARGYTQEQVKALLELNEAIQNGDISIQDFADGIVKLSGREQIIESFKNMFQALVNVVSPMKQAWNEIFHTDDIDKMSTSIYNILDAFRRFTARLVMSEESMDKLRRTFKGLFAILDIAWTIFKALWSILTRVVGALSGLGGGVLSVTACFGDFLVAIRDVVKGSRTIESFADSIANSLVKVIGIFRNFFTAAKERIHAPGLEKFVELVKTVWNSIKNIFSKIIDAVSATFNAVGDSVDGSGINVLLDLLNAFLAGGIFISIKKLFDKVSSVLDEFVGSFTGILDSVGDALEAFSSKVKADALKTIATSVLMLTISLVALSLINEDRLEKALAAILLLGAGLMGSLSVLGNVKSIAVSVRIMVGLAASLLLLTFALKKISEVPDDKMIPGLLTLLGAVGVLLAVMEGVTLITHSKRYEFDSKRVHKAVKDLFKISLSLIPLAIAMKIVGSMSDEQMIKGMTVMIGGMGLLLTALAVMALIDKNAAKVKIENNLKIVIGKCAQLALVAIALSLVAVSIALLSLVDWVDIIKGLTTMAVALGIMTKSLKTISKMDTKGTTKGAAAMVIMASVLGILGTQLMVLGLMKWSAIAKGLVAMYGMLLILTKVIKMLVKATETASGNASKAKTRDLILTTASLSIIAASLGLLSTQLFILGHMKWGTLTKGLIAMAGTLAAMAVIMKLLASFSKTKEGGTSLILTATSLVIVSTAIGGLAASVALLGQLKFSTILKGITAIALVLATLVGTMFLLSRTGGTTALLVLAGSIGILGAACFAAGAGIALIIWSISMISESLGNSIKTICKVIVDSAGVIGEAAAALIVGLLDGLVSVSDKLVESLATIIMNALRSMAEYIPEIVDITMDLLTGVVDKLIEYIPAILELIGKFLSAVFQGTVDLLGKIDTKALLGGVLALTALVAFIAGLAVISKLGGKALKGLAVMVIVLTTLGMVLGLLSKLPGFNDAIEAAGDTMEAIGIMIGQFIGGLLGGIAAGVATNIDTAVEVLQKLADPKVLASLAALTGITVVLSKFVNLKSAASGVLALAVVLSSVIAMMEIVSGVNIGAIQNGVRVLKVIGCADVIVALGLLTGLTAIVSLIAKIGSSFTSVLGVIGNLGVLVVGIAGLLLSLGSLNISNETLQAGVNTIKVLGSPELILSLGLMAGLLAVLALIGKINSNFTSVLSSLAGLGIVMAGVAGLCALLAFIPQEHMLKGAQMMRLIAGPEMVAGLLLMSGLTAILALIGASGAAGIVSVAFGLAMIAEVLAGLTLVVAAFGALSRIPGLQELINDGAKIFTGIGNAIGGLVGGIIGGIGAGITSTLPQMGADLAVFMKNLQPFLEGLNSVPKDSADAASKIADSLLTLTKATIRNSLTSWFTGGFDSEDLKNQFIGLGEAVSGFADKVRNIKSSEVKAGADAISTITSAIDKIPRTGGVEQWFTGNIKLEEFANNLTKLGQGIYNFNDKTKDITVEKVKGGSEALERIIQAIQNMPETSWWKETFSGSSAETMKNFKTYASQLGSGVKAFADNSRGINGENISNAANATKKLVDIIKIFPTSGGMLSVPVETINGLQAKLSSFANAINMFVSTIHYGSDTSRVDEVVNTLNKLSNAIKEFTKVGLDSIITSLKEFKLSVVLTASLYKAVATVYAIAPLFKAAGDTMFTSFANVVKTKCEKVVNTVKDMMDKVISSIKSPTMYLKFWTAGMWMVMGFAQGIKDNTFAAKIAATAMADAAVEAAEEALDNGSPSKRLRKTGGFGGAGFVLGLKDYTKLAHEAGSDLGENAALGLQKPISKISELIEDGIDVQPTITPVLDLSGVSYGMNSLNSMFGSSPALNVRANSISSIMNKNQNGDTNNDVVSAIKDLKSTVENNNQAPIQIGDIKYDSDSAVGKAVEQLIRAIKVEGRK